MRKTNHAHAPPILEAAKPDAAPFTPNEGDGFDCFVVDQIVQSLKTLKALSLMNERASIRL